MTKLNKPLLPSRLIVGLLGCTGCTLLYILRSNLSVAIVAMVDKHTLVDENENIDSQDLCYDGHHNNNTDYDPGYKGTYLWSESMQGVVLGSYFYGYSLTQISGGSLTERFGAKWICGLGVFLPALFNALTPIFAEIHVSLVIIVRIFIGAFHGWVFSGLFAMFAKWFPSDEKTLAITGTTLFGNMGGVITMPLAGYLCKTDFLGGWPTVFYVTSIIHVIWFILWVRYVHSSPIDDPNITEEELTYIKVNNPVLKSNPTNKKISTPWKAILTSKPVYASVVAKFTGSFGYYLLCAKMPKYLDSVFGMAIHTNSWFNSLMYLIICSSLLTGGPLSTYIKNKGWISQTRNRKNFQSFAQLGGAVCFLLVPIVDCDKTVVIALLLCGMFAYGFITGGEYAAIPEYAPDFSGTVFGFANTLSATTGFIAPLIVGILLDVGNGDRHQWNTVWYISGGVFLFGTLVYELFGTAEPQSWAVSDAIHDNEVKSKDILDDNSFYSGEKKISVISEHYKT